MDIRATEVGTKPFGDTPDVRMFWDTDQTDHVFSGLLANIKTAMPLQLIIAEPGNGKTLLCRKLFNSLRAHRTRYRVNLFPYPHLSDDDFARNVRFRNNNQPTVSHGARQDVLIIDEAQALPDKTLLILGNQLKQEAASFQLVLFAQPELEGRLRRRPLEIFQDLPQERFYLKSLSSMEVASYINYRMKLAGQMVEQLPDKAVIDLVFQASNGIPRLINTIMRKALVLAKNDQSARLEVQHIRTACETIEPLDSDVKYTSGSTNT